MHPKYRDFGHNKYGEEKETWQRRGAAKGIQSNVIFIAGIKFEL